MLNSGPGGIMVFDPPVMKISKGDTIHFKSVDMAHNSESIENMIPEGGDTWMGAMSQDISVTFNTEGVYVYRCTPHLMMAMVGVIQVGNNKNLEDVKLKASQLKNSFVKAASAMIGRSIWGSARKELSKISDDKIKKNMTKEFINFYEKNLVVETKLLKGVMDFLEWAKSNQISMGVCTNKQEHLAVELLKKLKIYDFFEYVAGGNTFDFCKPDPRHITNMIEIMGGNIKKSIMIGDSENDADAAKSAGIPMILVEDLSLIHI